MNEEKGKRRWKAVIYLSCLFFLFFSFLSSLFYFLTVSIFILSSILSLAHETKNIFLSFSFVLSLIHNICICLFSQSLSLLFSCSVTFSSTPSLKCTLSLSFSIFHHGVLIGCISSFLLATISSSLVQLCFFLYQSNSQAAVVSSTGTCELAVQTESLLLVVGQQERRGAVQKGQDCECI